MAAHRNVKLLAEQLRRFRPTIASIGSEEDAGRLQNALGGTEPQRHEGTKKKIMN